MSVSDALPMPRRIRVVACILKNKNRFLITRRMKHSHLGHLWEFPGGKIEPGESLEDCAVRECREELGIEVKPLRLLTEVQHDYPEVSVHLYFMFCEWLSGEIQALECADFTWATPGQFADYEFPAADKEVIERFVLNDNF